MDVAFRVITNWNFDNYAYFIFSLPMYIYTVGLILNRSYVLRQELQYV